MHYLIIIHVVVILSCTCMNTFLLKEKDDANLKLMSERIKAKSIQKLLNDEKKLFQAEISAVVAERDR